MNFLFGQAGSSSELLHADVELRLGAASDCKPEPFPTLSGQTIWTGSDGGAVLGRASDDTATLAFLGTIPQGVPRWTSSTSPLDDPDATAKFFLNAYRERGFEFLNGVPGSYVLVIQDRARGSVFLATDPAGSHGLFVLRRPGGIAFSTNLGLLRRCALDVTIDRGLETFLLGYQFLPEGRTVYSDVTSLPGGTLLEWKDDVEIQHKVTGWAGEAPDLEYADEAEIDTALYEGFMQAVEDVAPTNDTVSVVLGGFDSALVASALRRMGREVHTFTFYFEDQGYNQPHTDTLQKLIGNHHHPVSIGRDVIAEGLARYGRCFNQTAVQPHYPIESVEVCRHIRAAGMTHALTGDGCDGLFLGYPTIYRRTRVVKRLAQIPGALRSVAETLARSRALEARIGHPYRIARNLLTMLRRDPLVRDHFAARALDDFSLKWARGETLEQDRDVEDILSDLAQSVSHLSTVRRAYHSKALAGSNRNKMEGCLDGTGVAMISPFTHPRFAKIAASMGDEQSRPDGAGGGLGKTALMRMAENSGLLTREIIHQPKRSPAEAPVDGWYFGDLRPQVERLLDDLPFQLNPEFRASLFREKAAERLYRKRISLDDLATHALMALVTYAAFTGETNGPNG